MQLSLIDPAGGDAPRMEDLSRCVHCGLCLMSCPTFVVTGLEPESPRGRIALIRAANEGRIELNDAVLSHLDLCLGCRNCEAVCPSGVPYGRIIEGARAQIVAEGREPALRRRVRTAILRGLLPHRGRLRAVATALRWYERGGVQTLFRRAARRGLVPARLVQMEAMAPHIPDTEFRLRDARPAAGEPVVARVAFFAGCVMPFLYPGTQEATLRVLARNGIEVVTPRDQTCCGALMVHSGDREGARAVARRTVDLFLSLGVDAVIVNAAGCGSTLKEYHELLGNDPAYAGKAERFAHLVRDVTEFLADLSLGPGLGRVNARVTYQDSCHLAHAQRVKAQPRALIRAVPGVEFVDMPNADRCCGSAGIYNLVQPAMSMQVLDAKMTEVAETAPDIVVTANPGCMVQLEAGLRGRGMRARVMHVVDLLDLAYRSGAGSGKQGA